MKPTKKCQARKRKLDKVKAQIWEDRENCCAGCGTWSGYRAISHRVGVGQNLELEADPQNLDIMCHECHDHVECGRYDKLLNGEEIREYIAENDPRISGLKSLRRDFLAA